MSRDGSPVRGPRLQVGFIVLVLVALAAAVYGYRSWGTPANSVLPTPAPGVALAAEPALAQAAIPAAEPPSSPLVTPTSAPTPDQGTVLPALPTVAPAAAIRRYGYRVVAAYPHDPNAFTQGLVMDGGVLYEGTGLRGQSSLRRVDLETGQVQQIRSLSGNYFGEGIAVFDDRIVQLTWTSQVGFVYDRSTFELLGRFFYPHEGWGITHDGTNLIVSDGTSTLRFLDPETFAEVGRVVVADEQGAVSLLNELEYVDGLIYANVWQTDRIAMIEPESGRVAGWIELDGLLPPDERTPSVDVLNGIAYDAVEDRLLVTGKRWPRLYHIELVSLDIP